MYLKNLGLDNFRSFGLSEIPLCKDLTILVGENNGGKSNAIRLFQSRSNLFNNTAEMHSHIQERSGFRDHALYATDEGVNQFSGESLALLLQDHAFLTLGLVWAAIDVG